MELKDFGWWLVVVPLLSFVAGLAVTVILVVNMPEDALCRKSQWWRCSHSARGWTLLILKNLLGIVIIIAGVLMLVLPGPGILTILAGLMMLDVPGKRRFQRYLVSRPGVLKNINRLRARFCVPPLQAEDGAGRPIVTEEKRTANSALP